MGFEDRLKSAIQSVIHITKHAFQRHNLSNGFEWSIMMTNVFVFLEEKNESTIAQIASYFSPLVGIYYY